MYSSVTNNYILYTLFGLSGSLFIFGVCRNFIVKNAFLEYIGMNTITILAIKKSYLENIGNNMFAYRI